MNIRILLFQNRKLKKCMNWRLRSKIKGEKEEKKKRERKITASGRRKSRGKEDFRDWF